MPTYSESVHYHAQLARAKREMMQGNPIGFLILCIFAGAYVGLGVILIFSIGQHLEPSMRPLVMGATFGLALLLVVFAGAELFTGHTMYFAHGLLVGTTSVENLMQSWITTWVGNLVGAFVLSTVFVAAGGGHIVSAEEGASLLHEVAAKKAATQPAKLVLLGMLCNWLVCLALWSASRTKNDAAKLSIICFCLLGFIASGYEHVIANMTIFAIALMSDSVNVTPGGAAGNLFWVTLGNTFAGAGVMGLGYWLAAGRPVARPQPVHETF